MTQTTQEVLKKFEDAQVETEELKRRLDNASVREDEARTKARDFLIAAHHGEVLYGKRMYQVYDGYLRYKDFEGVVLSKEA